MSTIFSDTGVDLITLPICSLELNPIELMFNAIVQRHANEFVGLNIISNNDTLTLFYKVVDSITPDVMFTHY